MLKNKFMRLVKPVFGLTMAAVIMVQGSPVLGATTNMDELGFVTTKVERGDLIVNVEATASVEFTQTTQIVFESELGSTTFVKYLVERGDVVEEGQPIAEIYSKLDEIALEEQRIYNERTLADCEAFYESYEDQLKQAKDAVKNAQNETEKKIAKLRLEQRQMELDRSKISVDERVEAIRKQQEANEQALAVTQIFAPAAGSIGWLNRYKMGDTIWDGTVLGEIFVWDNPIYTVKDTTGILRYGMELVIVDKQGNEYPARIISCSKNNLSKEFATEVAYIQADGIPLTKMWDLMARYDTIHMEKILKVDARAVKTDTDGTYVMELLDGKLIKRYFQAGRNIGGMYHIMDGLEEGVTVIIN